MSIDMKNKVLEIVKNKLGVAEDNLYRANMQFGKMSAEELKQEYGQSGRTCGSVLAGYQNERDELIECVKWVEGAAMHEVASKLIDKHPDAAQDIVKHIDAKMGEGWCSELAKALAGEE